MMGFCSWTRLLALAATAHALFVHPGVGQSTTLKPKEQKAPPPIDPFNPFGASEDEDGPFHGHQVVGDHLTTDHVDVLARLAAKLKHMRLRDIEEVVVIGLSETEVELQVMTCEDEECVVVRCAIDMYPPCGDADDDSYEECVLGQLTRIDESMGDWEEEEGPGADDTGKRRARFLTFDK